MTVPEQHILIDGARSFDIQLDGGQLAQFARYQEMIQEWNQRINLTAIVEAEAIQLKHFVDSLSCTTATGQLTGQRLIDVGTGAGFPGIPLKILFPGLQLTLVESVGKKCRFLEATTSSLGLVDVVILNDRVENIGQQTSHRQVYDWAVARAVSSLSVLAEYLLPLVHIGGHILAQKGDSIANEIRSAEKAMGILGGAQAHAVPIRFHGLTENRHLVISEKIAPTPAKYPRRAGVPGNNPLS